MSDNTNTNEHNNEALMDENQPESEQPKTNGDDGQESPQQPEVDMTALQQMVEQLQNDAQTNLDGWQRSRAEFNNYRRRTQQQLADSKQQGAMDALAKILPIIDDFERAFDNVPDELSEHPWVTGTALILKNIQKVMDEFNIEVLDPVGEEFDPNIHEAIGMEDSNEYDSGIVTTTLQKGYKSGDRVLRPALVRVAS